MIAFLRGTLTARGSDWAEVDAGGIGFRAAISTVAAGRLPPPGTEVVLPTVMVVREDGVSLFGFVDDAERQAFRDLVGVAGIGGRTALAVLSRLPPSALAEAVDRGDERTLVSVPGIGRKTAQRILLELKGRLPAEPLGPEPAPDSASGQAVAALQGLGYPADRAATAVEASQSEAADAEGLVRAALRRLASR